MQKQVLPIIESISFYIVLIVVLLLPVFFLPITTDSLELPKQLLFVTATLLLLLLFGLKGVFEHKVTFRRTPFDLAVAVIFVVVLISTIVSPAKATSIVASIPFFAVLIFYFLLTNTAVNQERERILISAALLSGAIVAILNVLQFLKIYILPYALAKAAGFSLTGSLLTSIMLLASLLPIGLMFVFSHLRKKQDELWSGFFLGTTILLVAGGAIAMYQLMTTAKPLLLPQDTGLRTALQPLGVNFQTALFGTGPGTYLYNFTRFKDPALNANSTLWNIRFTSSSSFFLEMLSTLGVVGAISFLFLAFRLISSFLKNGNYDLGTLGISLSLVLLIVLSIFLPFSFVLLAFLFILLGLYAIHLGNEKSHQIYDVTISVVALKKGLISLEREPARHSSATDILPHLLFGLLLLLGVLLLLPLIPGNMYNYIVSDITFQQALVAANANQAKQTYDLQNQAILMFPNRALYHRVFAQTNLLIANSIATTAQAGGTLNPQDRQNIITLAQQAINFGRNAVTLAPLDVANWENLTGIYRGLIGFAQSADQFSIASAQQAISLDPTNPFLWITLGGLYYQLGQYDNAIQQFNQAINLKRDYANAYYNLGHAYEAKGDAASLTTALGAYQQVKALVEPGSADAKKIDDEIAVLKTKLPEPAKEAEAKTGETAGQEPLKVNTPSAVLPTQKPPVEVKGPPTQ